MNLVNLEKISRKPQNGFVGRRIDGSSIVKVDIGDNPKLKALMIDRNPASMLQSWDEFCDALGDLDPRGEIEIDWLFIDGSPRRFH